MIRLLIAGLLLVSVNTVADTKVTHTFKDGDIIEAEEFNKNFDDLEAAIDTVLTATADGEAIALTSTAGGASAISLTTNHGTSETIAVTNLQGQSSGAIALTANGGGINLSASLLKLNPGTNGLITKRVKQTVADSATDPTAAQYVAGFIHITGGGGDTVVLPTGPALADAMFENPVSVGDSFICYVVNEADGQITYTLAGGTGSFLTPMAGTNLRQGNETLAKFEFIFTDATVGAEKYYALFISSG